MAYLNNKLLYYYHEFTFILLNEFDEYYYNLSLFQSNLSKEKAFNLLFININLNTFLETFNLSKSQFESQDYINIYKFLIILINNIEKYNIFIKEESLIGILINEIKEELFM